MYKHLKNTEHSDCSTRLSVTFLDYISFMAFWQIIHISLSLFLCEVQLSVRKEAIS